MSIKFAARSSAKSKAKRLTKVTTGKVDASGWTQPRESTTPRTRRAYAAGGKVDKYVGEVEKEAGCKPRGDKRPRKMDGGPLTGNNDPRTVANNMMQQAASQAPVSGNSPIPTFSSTRKSPMRGGFKKGGKVDCDGDRDDKKPSAKTPAGTNYAKVPKKLPLSGNTAIMPDTDGGPAFKKGGRAERKAGGRVKGKTNINIIIAPAGGGEQQPPAPAMGAPMGKPPGMPPMPPAPPAGGPPGAPGAGAAPNPMAGLPPQLIAAALGGGGGGQGASMPPAGPPHLPMRAAGGRLVRETAGAGGGKGRLEKTQAAHAEKLGNRGL